MDNILLSVLYEIDKEIYNEKELGKTLSNLDKVRSDEKINGLEIAKKIVFQKLD